ncbi:MAG: DUF177 domain-containing protein [Desulfurivibrionaceae bacterium]|nr:DUF177 domain-containing protein [Desulfobulbales bacterium]MDT8334545.1 DUF177 domain-containing protein [Desulfurivibrionaceae bacterium]
MLRVNPAEIPEDGLSLKVADMSWFPRREVSCKGEIRAELFLKRSGEKVFVAGSVKLVMLFVCDRCLESFELPREMDFQVIYDFAGEDPALQDREHECDINEVDVVFPGEPVIDLGHLLTQQVILAVPQKRLCRSDCLGLCPECGEDLNKTRCDCKGGGVDSPFNVLGGLLNQKNSN